MSEKIEGCTAPFGMSGYIKSIPACMSGHTLEGCVQRETCEVWSKYGGREIFELGQSALYEAIADELIPLRENRPAAQFKEAAHAMLDKALVDFEGLMSEIDAQSNNDGIEGHG